MDAATATAAPTDAELLTILRRNPGALVSAQAEAGALMRQAMALPFAPKGRIEAQWATFQKRMTAAAAPPGTNHNSAVDQGARVAMLRVAHEAAGMFGGYVRMRPPEIMELWRQDRDDTVRAMHAATATYGARHNEAAFDPALAVQQLAGRGVALSIGSDGSLLASPSGLLTKADKAALVAHEAVLREFLGTAERVA